MRRRLSYKILAEVLAPHESSFAFASAGSIREMEARQRYLDLLSAGGWTEEEFDTETLRRIDQSWDITTPPPRGNHPMVLASLRGMAGIPHWKIQTSSTIH